VVALGVQTMAKTRPKASKRLLEAARFASENYFRCSEDSKQTAFDAVWKSEVGHGMATAESSLSQKMRLQRDQKHYNGSARTKSSDALDLQGSSSPLERSVTVTSEEQWGPLLLESLFRPLTQGEDNDDDDIDDMDEVQRADFLRDCKSILRSLLPTKQSQHPPEALIPSPPEKALQGAPFRRNLKQANKTCAIQPHSHPKKGLTKCSTANF
jgi:hypothetical protein